MLADYHKKRPTHKKELDPKKEEAGAFHRRWRPENRCWACGCICQSSKDLQDQLHESVNFEESTHPWADDKYLNCFLEEDRPWYSFSDDEEEYAVIADNDEIVRNLGTFENINIDDEKYIESDCNTSLKDGQNASAAHLNTKVPLEKVPVGSCSSSNGGSYFRSPKDKHLKKNSTKISEDEIKNVNKNYYDSYSSYGVHREMISDKAIVCSFIYDGFKTKTNTSIDVKGEQSSEFQLNEIASTPTGGGAPQDLAPNSEADAWPPSSQPETRDLNTEIDLAQG